MPRRFAITLAPTLAIPLVIGFLSGPPARAQGNSPSVAGILRAGDFQSGSEARRAELCAGDYVCDEDGSWAIGSISPTEQLMRSSLAAIERTMQNGKVVSASEPYSTPQQPVLGAAPSSRAVDGAIVLGEYVRY